MSTTEKAPAGKEGSAADSQALSGGTSRLSYFDTIRSFVIILVVAMHTSVCYSGIGGWYYKEGSMEALGAVELVVFAFLQSFIQAWFMGILFFISAYFAALSLARKGNTAFVRERLFRLGSPLLVYMFIIAPFIYFVLLGEPAPASLSVLAADYGQYFASFEWLGSTGPLWFSEALLIFCCIYVVCRSLRPHPASPAAVADVPASGPATVADVPVSRPAAAPGCRKIMFLILGTAIAAFLIRLVFPIGTDVLNLQFSFFASYIALFVLGIKAGEGKWLESIAVEKGRLWFKAALAIGVPLWFVIIISGGALEGKMLFYGGFYWQSAVYALWESFTAIGFSLGLIWFFRKFCNSENKAARLFAGNAFGIYMFHPPLLISISLLLRFWEASAALKFIVVTPLAITASLVVTALLRQIPPVRALIR